MSKKYIIFAPSYLETSGGIVVLHKLCSILNDLGHESYLYPSFETYELNKIKPVYTCLRYIKARLSTIFRPYKTNPAFNTPVWRGKHNDFDDHYIIIYSEIVFGNPLKAKNVVRWLLHQPGFHSGKIYYGQNELYFKFNSAINDFSFPGSVTSSSYLKIIHYPLEYYNMKDIPSNRKGTAYCLRKGKHKKIQHDLKNSILIDGKTNTQGKSHKEVSDIFKSVETFISYDTYTAYSIFAVLCGCISIVIPDEGVKKEEWYPNETDRYGLAYGFDEIEIENSKLTAPLVKKHIEKEEKNSIDNVRNFVKEVENYFK